MDIDDSVLQDGFSDFLVMAYSGNLTLEEYVRLVENSCWARKYQCPLPESIDWSTYERIAQFAFGNELMFLKNRKLYIDKMNDQNIFCCSHGRIYQDS